MEGALSRNASIGAYPKWGKRGVGSGRASVRAEGGTLSKASYMLAFMVDL
jgi:hypothetical protein